MQVPSRKVDVSRLAAALLCAVAFGVAMSVLKGNDAGLRDDAGNLSAPWLLLPFFVSAATVRRMSFGAVAGTLATVAGLTGFYVANAFVLDLGPHGAVTDLRLAMTGFWFQFGLLSGTVFGALGAAWRGRGYPVIGAAVLLLLDLEALFWPVARAAGGIPGFAFAPAPAVVAAEALLGLALCAAAVAVVRE